MRMKPETLLIAVMSVFALTGVAVLVRVGDRDHAEGQGVVEIVQQAERAPAEARQIGAQHSKVGAQHLPLLRPQRAVQRKSVH